MPERLDYATPAVTRPDGRVKRTVLRATAVAAALAAAVLLSRLGGRTMTPSLSTVASYHVLMFQSALDAFHADVGRFPTAAEGLDALVAQPPGATGTWRGPYIGRGLPVDPWSRPYLYRALTRRGIDGYEVLCSGPDRLVGTPDDISTGFVRGNPAPNR